MQGVYLLTTHDHVFRSLCFSGCLLCTDFNESIQRRIDSFNCSEMGLNQLDRRYLAQPYAARHLHRAQAYELAHSQGRGFSLRWSFIPAPSCTVMIWSASTLVSVSR